MKRLMLHTLHSCSCKLKCATKWKWSGRRWRHGNKEHQLSSRKMYLLLFACHFSIIIVLLSTVRRVAGAYAFLAFLILSMLCTHQHSPFFSILHISHFFILSLSFSLCDEIVKLDIIIPNVMMMTMMMMLG
jgi:hypothetical protein